MKEPVVVFPVSWRGKIESVDSGGWKIAFKFPDDKVSSLAVAAAATLTNKNLRIEIYEEE